MLTTSQNFLLHSSSQCGVRDKAGWEKGWEQDKVLLLALLTVKERAEIIDRG